MRVSSCVGFYFIQAVTNSIGANVSLNRIQVVLLNNLSVLSFHLLVFV